MPSPFSERSAIFPAGEAEAQNWLNWLGIIQTKGKKPETYNGGGGGSRTPVRKALRAEDYMLSSVQFFSPATLRMSKKRSRLVRWFSPEPYGPKGSSQPAE